MKISRRQLERSMPIVLALLKQNQGIDIPVIDRMGKILFFVRSGPIVADNLKKTPTDNLVDSPTVEAQKTPTSRQEVFQTLKKQFATPTTNLMGTPTLPDEAPRANEVVGRKDKKYRVLGQSPYGRDDIKYTTSYGA